LHQIAHPLLAEVTVGETILKQLVFQLETNEETVFLAVASYLVNFLDRYGPLDSLVVRVVVNV
jgi:hypothetical protein